MTQKICYLQKNQEKSEIIKNYIEKNYNEYFLIELDPIHKQSDKNRLLDMISKGVNHLPVLFVNNTYIEDNIIEHLIKEH